MHPTLRTFLLWWGVAAGALVAVAAFRGDPVWERPGGWLVAAVASAVAAALVVVRSRMRQAVRERAQQERAQQGLPPLEERSFGEDLRDHPVRTVAIAVLLLAGLGVAVYLKVVL